MFFFCLLQKRKTLSPKQEWALIDILGTSYRALGEPKAALPHAKRDLNLAIQLFGKGSKEHANALSVLSYVETKLKDYPSAKMRLNEGLAILVALGEEKSSDYGSMLIGLANMDFDQERWAAALEGLIKAKAVMSNFKEHPSYGVMVCNKAVCYKTLNRWTEALACFREVVELDRKMYGNQHPDYATSINNLAVAYSFIKQVAIAIPLYEEALAIRKRVYGNNHPETITVIENLAKARDYLKLDRKAIKTPADVRMCNNCLKIDKSIDMMCSCRKVNYCNAECQEAHWTKHRPDCIQCYSCGELCKGDMVRCVTCYTAKYCNESCRDGSKDEHGCVARCYQCRNDAEKLLRCAGCHVAKYCSANCQRKHWTSEHKTQCKKK